MKITNAIVVYTIPRNMEQKLSLDTVKHVLRKHRIKFLLADRDRLEQSQFRSRDIVIAVGGDGTFLRAAQFIEKTPIFGVNAEPGDKEGFFMKSTKSDFEKKLLKILRGDFNLIRLSRLYAKVNGKKVDSLALNEFFIGPRKSYHASKYVIKIAGMKERHKSSGVLVATPAGSHAWASASSGKKMNLDSREFQFVVREPYEGNVFRNYRLTRGILEENEKIEIVSEMLDGLLVADSVGKEFPVRAGQKIQIGLSKKPIKAIWF